MKPLEQTGVYHVGEVSGSQDPLDRLAEEFAQACRQGTPPDIEAIATQFPLLADEIRDLFPLIATLEADKRKSASKSSARLDFGTVRPGRLGDYTITREIGRGGMGIVYEATQETLKRRVAIKVLPPMSTMPDNSTARFLREAQMAARLQHAHIVPVFGIGHEQGFHYIVMQLIQGTGLDHLIRDPRKHSTHQAALLETRVESGAGTAFPEAPRVNVASQNPDDAIIKKVDPKRLAELGVQAADAMYFAHEQGVLHRDIKPANLLLDDTGHLWISDFGLAKALHQESISRSTDLVGTLMYMAPERFRGACDVRSDIYALGLTLAELALGHAVFSNRDTGSLLEQILRGLPQQRGALDKTLPYDLEMILLKAIAPAPENRYGSALELLADLQAFLENRPILARPPTPPERLWRWGLRNPTIAALSLSTVGLLLLTTITTSFGFFQQRKMRNRTQATLETTLRALDNVYQHFAGTIGEDEFRSNSVDTGGSVLSHESAVMLTRLLETYEDLSLQGAANDRLLAEAAIAQQRVGEIQLRLGQAQESLEATRKAIGRIQDLVVHDLNPRRSWEIRLADSWNQLASAQTILGSRREAQESRGESLLILSSLAQQFPEERKIQLRLAETHLKLGQVHAPLAADSIPWLLIPLRFEGDRRPQERPIVLQPPRGPDFLPYGPSGPPGNGGRRPDFEGPPGRFDDGPPPLDRQRPWHWAKAFIPELTATESQLHHLQQAREILNRFCQSPMKDLDAQGMLALVLRELGTWEKEATKSRVYLDEAVQLLDELLEQQPQASNWIVENAVTSLVRFELSSASTIDDWLAQEHVIAKDLKRVEELVSRQPLVPSYSLLAAILHDRLAVICIAIMDRNHLIPPMELTALADEHNRKALAAIEPLCERYPQVSTYALWRERMRLQAAVLPLHHDNPRDSIPALRRSLKPGMKSALPVGPESTLSQVHFENLVDELESMLATI